MTLNLTNSGKQQATIRLATTVEYYRGLVAQGGSLV